MLPSWSSQGVFPASVHRAFSGFGGPFWLFCALLCRLPWAFEWSLRSIGRRKVKFTLYRRFFADFQTHPPTQDKRSPYCARTFGLSPVDFGRPMCGSLTNGASNSGSSVPSKIGLFYFWDLGRCGYTPAFKVRPLRSDPGPAQGGPCARRPLPSKLQTHLKSACLMSGGVDTF